MFRTDPDPSNTQQLITNSTIVRKGIFFKHSSDPVGFRLKPIWEPANCSLGWRLLLVFHRSASPTEDAAQVEAATHWLAAARDEGLQTGEAWGAELRYWFPC